MRELHVRNIEEAVSRLFIAANRELPASLESCIRTAAAKPQADLPQGILCRMVENLETAKQSGIPICQDTGMAVVFADLGQEVHITGGSLERAIHNGVARGCREGYLRACIVRDPLRRENTGDNTPAVLHLRLTEGEKLHLTVAPKGFGSENMSRLAMLTPAAQSEDILQFIEETVRIADGNPCPPLLLGVGLGGDFESCALMAKRALCRDSGLCHPDPFYQALEEEALQRVNALGIGPQGFGGTPTAFAVHIETASTHIAGLPVAVNVGCHVTRHASVLM